MAIFVFLVLCLVWGFSWVAIKLSLEGIPPFLSAGLRFLLAVPFLVAYARLKRIPALPQKSELGMIILTSVLLYGFDYGMIYWAEQTLSAGVTAILFATFPLFTGILSHLVFKSEALRASVYLGLVVGFTGVAVTFYDELEAASVEGRVIAAMLATICAAVSAALTTILVKKHLSNTRPVTLSISQIALGGLGLSVLAVARGEPSIATWTSKAVLGLIYLSLIASALAFTMYYWLLKKTSAVTLASMIYVTPVVALIADRFVFGEPITLQTTFGMLLIFAGIAISELPKYRSQLSSSR